MTINSEYANYHSRPEQIKKRSLRNQARRTYEKAHGDLPSDMDVDHKKALSKGGDALSLRNLRATTDNANRSFARQKDNGMKSQTSKRERKK